MANKVKLKCGTCGKMFKANKTQPFCDECERKRRHMKAVTPATTPKVAAAGKPQWLATATERDEASLTQALAGLPPAPRPSSRSQPVAIMPQVIVQPEQVKKKTTPPLAPYAPTPADIQRIEQRYLALAQPEFDGIRTQIAQELQIPKRVVKDVVAALRTRMNLPSWWEARPFIGSTTQLQQISDLYLPTLPVPPIGIHKEIATQLSLPRNIVYQAIATLRRQLRLPRHAEQPSAMATVEQTAS